MMHARTWLALLLTLLLGLLGCSKADRSAKALSAAAPPPPPPPAAPLEAPPARKALLDIHASLEVDVGTAERAAAMTHTLGDFVRSRGGWVAESNAASDVGLTRLVLRVPPSELPALRALFAGRGSVLRDGETATDVTDAIADLDARLRAARLEESRILKLLEERSGTISDVLAAERALADVRQRVERLEAEQRVAQGRVELATVEVTLRHAAQGAEETTGEGLARAAKDGVTVAKSVALGTLALTLRGGPTLLFVGVFGLGLIRLVKSLRLRLVKSLRAHATKIT